jgi:hypothetical protein
MSAKLIGPAAGAWDVVGQRTKSGLGTRCNPFDEREFLAICSIGLIGSVSENALRKMRRGGGDC